MKVLPPALLLCLLISSACEKGYEPDLDNDEEVITYVELTLSPHNGGANKVFRFSDPDGAGGEEPLISSDSLQANTSYSATLSFLDESVDPPEDINAEIIAESTEHQVFFRFSPDSVFEYSYVDMDASGLPLGLQTHIEVGNSSGAAEIRLILRHQPNKTAAGVMDGDISRADGDSDIEVSFPSYILP